MQFRKTLLAGAAMAAAGLLSFAPSAHALSSINYVTVDGVSSPSPQPFSGTYASGTATFAGLTFGCSGGSVSGDIETGPISGPVDVAYEALNLTCDGPLGIDANIELNSTTCATGTFEDTDATDGPNDVISGDVSLATGCGQITAGSCTANVQGDVSVEFDETTNELILNGTGFNLTNQSASCLGFMTGSVGLNNITFDVSDVIDFRTNP